MKLGLYGFGVIGRGVYTLVDGLRGRYDLDVKKVFDLPIKKEVLGDKLVCDIDAIANDEEIEIVFECLGGHDVPYEVITKCLSHGKSVITSNKEVVSMHLEEFINLAHENKCSFLFEASVGGGVPILKCLIDNVKVNEVNDIFGIVNGTTNYILTKMADEGLDFVTALDLARKNGFAEANPTADLEGLDMVRKINILSSIAYKGVIKNEDIYHFGMSGVNKPILDNIKNLGYVLKFVASSHRDGNDVTARVEPTMVPKDHVLAAVKNEFNSIMFTGSTNSTLEFYGKGAGSLPTATAMVADMIQIIDGRGYIDFKNERNLIVNAKPVNYKYYVVDGTNHGEFKERLTDNELRNYAFYARVID